MCSVARNFSRFSSCRLVLLLVCSTTSSAEHVTSAATPGTDVSTLGGAHGVTEAAATVGSSAVFTVAIPDVDFSRLASESLATDADGALGYSRSTPSNSSLAASRLPYAARIWASNVLAEGAFSELSAAARCACSFALEYSCNCAYALASSKCPRSEDVFICSAFSSVCAAAAA